MKVRLRITSGNRFLYTGAYDVVDADSFGQACADAWGKLRQMQSEKESSIGALMEHLDDMVLDQLNGAHIGIERA